MPTEQQADPSRPRREREIASWNDEADVVVVGFGAAGACTAIEAAEAGADVLVVERAGGGGGTSAMSGGLIYMGGGTPVQEACGYEDSPEDMFRFLVAALGPRPDEAKIRLFCEQSVAHFHWLESHGVPFKRSFYPEPGLEAPTDDCLVFSGGEDGHPFDRIARPAPRAHKPRHPAAAGGFLMQKLVAATERSGARVVCDARTDALVTADDGSVVGVVVRHDGSERAVRARGGVVLTAGGFVKNEQMVALHQPRIAACSFKLGVDGDDGRAIRMAMAAGADAIRMDAAEVALPITPPRRLVRGLVVNRHGQRFINEDTYYGRVGQEALFRHDGQVFLVVDNAIYERNALGFEATFVEETVAELESAAGFPDGALQATVNDYNRFAARGEDPLFHKVREFVQPLLEPPFAVIDCRPDKVLWATFTLGGLHTSPTGEVLDPGGRAIAGLYAAGRTTSGIAAYGYCSGISLGDATFFGREAGRTVGKAGKGGGCA